MDDKTYCVYKHTSPSGKVYIGMSCDPKKRWNSGKGYIDNYHFWRAIQKYGWDNIKHEILYEDLSLEDAMRIETELIKELKCTDRNFGYNLMEGSHGPFSEESLRKMSLSRMGNQNSKGNHLSDESKKKISESLKEYYKTHPHPNLGKTFIQNMGGNHVNARQVCLIDNDGNILKIYGSIADASRDTGRTRTSISDSCSGRYRSRDGYNWRYYKDGTFVPVTTRQYTKSPDENAPKKVAEVDSDGQVISTFESITAAAKKCNCDISCVAKCCKGKAKQVKGHIFRYLSEVNQPQADFLIA